MVSCAKFWDFNQNVQVLDYERGRNMSSYQVRDLPCVSHILQQLRFVHRAALELCGSSPAALCWLSVF